MYQAQALTTAAIQTDLHTTVIGCRVECAGEVSSTNDWARSEAAKGAPDGSVYLAESQARGRGQAGRTWLDLPGASILASILMRPPLAASDAFLVSMLTACAGAAAVERASGLGCTLKWPNDLILTDRKVGGILVETSLMGNSLEYVVVGIGLNVSLDVRTYPEIAESATSLAEHIPGIDRLTVVRDLLRQMDLRYQDLCNGGGERIFGEWRSRLNTIGRRVVLLDREGGREEVQALDVETDGALVARRDDGSVRFVRIGEVSLR